MNPTPALRQAFAPLGMLRASINLGNPLLARRDADSGAVSGVSVDLAHALAKHLGVGVVLEVFDKAQASVEAVRGEEADVGFFAIDPQRSAGLSFTAPYLLIEGGYLVPDASAIHSVDEVDRPGHRVAVGQGSAYDLFLSRHLQHAQIVRAATPAAVLDTFVAQRLEVAAGIRQALAALLPQHPGHRLLPGRFMVIEQAMGCPASRGADAAAALAQFVESMKASGFVADALVRHGVTGATVAPAAG